MGIKEFIQRQSEVERDNIRDFSFREAKKQPIFFDPEQELGAFEWQEIKTFLNLKSIDVETNTFQYFLELLGAYKLIVQGNLNFTEISEKIVAQYIEVFGKDRASSTYFRFGTIIQWLKELLAIIDFIPAVEREKFFSKEVKERCAKVFQESIYRYFDPQVLYHEGAVLDNAAMLKRVFPDLIELRRRQLVDKLIETINARIREGRKSKESFGEALRLSYLLVDFRVAFPAEFKRVKLSSDTLNWMIKEWRQFREVRRAEGPTKNIYGIAVFVKWAASLMIITAAEINVSLEKVEVIEQKEDFTEEREPLPIRLSF